MNIVLYRLVAPAVWLAACASWLAPLAAWSQNTQCAVVCNGTDNACYRSCAGGRPDSASGGPGSGKTRSAQHGAIAVSMKTGTFGYAWGQPAKLEATRRALAECAAQPTRPQDCTVAVTFHDACGALAMAPDRSWGADWGSSPRQAQAKALARCKKVGGQSCVVEKVVCASG